MQAWWRGNDRRSDGQRDAIRVMSTAGSTCPATVMFLVAFLVASPARPPWGGQVEKLPGATMLVNGVSLRVEVARSPEAQQRGLGYRDGLANDTGMLFAYDEAAAHTFWMKGMRFCLDIVWVERNTIVGAAESICPAPAGTSDAAIPRARAPEPVHDVLEVRADWLAAHGINVGSRVIIHLDEPAR